jgi:hypothetical protein
MSTPPAISTSSETHPIPEINGSSHSSKNTLGRFGNRAARLRTSAKRVSGVSTSPFARIDHRAQHPNHIEDPGDASLIEGMDVEPTANEIGDDIRL